MKLPNHPSLQWAAIGVLAYLTGSLLVATLENRFIAQPARVQAKAAPSEAKLDGLTMPDELARVLSNAKGQTASNTSTNTTTTAVANTGVGVNSTTVSAGNATALPTLAGTLEGQGQSLAVLQMGADTQVVAVGEEWNGFRVLEVSSFEARVRDPRNQEFTISMKLAQMSETPANTTPPQPVGALPTIGQPLSPGNTTAPPSGPPTKRELREELENRGKWIRNIMVQPVVRNEETVGVQLNYRDNNNPLARLGLLSGDIVMSLNNKPIKGATDMGDIVNELRNSDSLNFQVERAGQVIPHSITLLP